LKAQTYDYQSNKANVPRDMATVIVKAVAKTLNLPLVSQTKVLPIDAQFDQLFSEAEEAVRQRVFPAAIENSKKLTGRYPQYAPGWELLAQAYRLQQSYDPMLRSGSRSEAREFGAASRTNAKKAAQQAIRVDPQSAPAYSILASVEAQSGQWADAVGHGRKAFEINPNDPNVLHDFSQILTITGYIREALAQRERLLKLEPTVPAYNLLTGDILQINGRQEESIKVLESIPADGPQSYFRNVFLARAYAADKRYDEAADMLLAIVGEQVSSESVQEAAELLRNAPKNSKPQRPLEGELNFVYFYIGEPETVLDNVERYIDSNNMTATGMRALWAPEFSPIRKTRRFKELVRKAHMYDYWRKHGWPDLCAPKGGNDFDCV
jgi:tetratricopeptide (TPR) repeat protein